LRDRYERDGKLVVCADLPAKQPHGRSIEIR